jgi:hypothetical protein
MWRGSRASSLGRTARSSASTASGDALAVARDRAARAGERHVSFVEADVRTWRASEPFDAVTGRLILFHLPDRSASCATTSETSPDDGVFVAVDFDLGGARTEPAVPLAHELLDWVTRAFSAGRCRPADRARGWRRFCGRPGCGT